MSVEEAEWARLADLAALYLLNVAVIALAQWI